MGTFYDQINELIKPHVPPPAEAASEDSLDPVPESEEDKANAKTI